MICIPRKHPAWKNPGVMVMPKRPLSTRIIELIPQTLFLRSGMLIELRNKHDSREFWRVFTSPEYMSFIPELISLRVPSISVLDCGACIGLFSLLIEHLRRIGVLPWDNVSYTLIEPSPYNFGQLERNVRRNLPEGSYRLINGLVGLKDGDSDFYESKRKPSSSGLSKRDDIREKMARMRLPFIDIAGFLKERPCLLKVDIEGAEFMMLETYSEALSNVEGLVIEWHCEMGDMKEGESMLSATGFHKAKESLRKGDRVVALYMRP
jgi:FkbM family methyltransferase